ncbi:MAG: hypothetical protein H5T66_03930 [Chloroflexi bacterium]|nr:hypothetical protein [Chloroflexota bacterium]
MTSFSAPFHPDQHGFAFPNRFERALCAGGRKISYGLCGGMCFAALDYWHAGIPIPGVEEAPQKGALWAYLVRRQIDSLSLPWGIIRILWWMLQRDERLLEWTLGRELVRLGTCIARGEPVVLVLVRKVRLASITENHQVVAIALEEDERAQEAMISLYDPNSPGKVSAIVIHRAASTPAEALREATDEPLRGFYVARYRPRRKGLPRL